MMPFPEMSLEPPDPIQAGTCPVCGGELYEKDPCWKKDGEVICLWHLDAVMADYLDYRRAEV